MHAVGFYKHLSLDHEESLLNIEIEKPQITQENPLDLLIEVKAVSVNPIDNKLRRPSATTPSPKDPYPHAKILGFDAAGVVVAKGKQCKKFKEGDKVYYAGDMTRQGSNASFQLVHEDLVALMPKNLSFEEAAAFPLTSITAYECLFEKLSLNNKNLSFLIINGAGGVGSMSIQLLKAKLPSCKIIATASREESQNWCKTLGANFVIPHKKALSLPPELGTSEVDHILCFADPDSYYEDMIRLSKPFGSICCIVDFLHPEAINLNLLKKKSLSFMWEFMFSKPLFKTSDCYKHGEILKELANLIEENKIQKILHTHLGKLNALNLKKAHQLMEDKKSIGKVVLSI